MIETLAAGDRLHSVLFGSSLSRTIIWRENDGQGTFAERQHKIAATITQFWTVADMDGDGDLDVLNHEGRHQINDPEGEEIVWYENTDGQGSFGDAHLVAWQPDGISWISTSDLDSDGDLDVLSYGRGFPLPRHRTISWYENTDGQGTFGPERLINTQTTVDVRSIVVVDIDEDRDMDVLATSDAGRVASYYENTDGRGTFSTQQAIMTKPEGFATFQTADLDGDGNKDLLASVSGNGTTVWYENISGSKSFGAERIVGGSGLGVRSLLAADLDGDGDRDLLAASLNGVSHARNEPALAAKIFWYENIDGQGTFSSRQLITARIQTAGIISFAVADVDADGDIDVVSSLSEKDYPNNSTIAWHENSDGSGSFGTQHEIAVGLNTDSLAVADLDGDGDVDVLAASKEDDTIAWYENEDGEGAFGKQRVISRQAVEVQVVVTADINLDGNLDVLFASERSGTAWIENRVGHDNWGTKQRIRMQADGVRSVVMADIDGDGDLDVVSALGLNENVPQIGWNENTDGRGTFGPQQVIAVEPARGQSVATSDVDGDGDLDVLAAFARVSVLDDENFGTDQIVWYENTDGAGAFGPQQFVSHETDFSYETPVMTVADFDDDGNPDIVSAPTRQGAIIWHENENRLLGDVNDDGMFNSSDLVLVFQSGEYEDHLPNNSTFDEGDWNGDGEFDSADLVVAFQAGHYEAGARSLATDMAAAVDRLFAEDEEPLRGKAFIA